MNAAVYIPLETRVVFGSIADGRLAAEAERLGMKRPLFLSTPQQAGSVKRLASEAGIAASMVFPGAAMHTPVEVTEAALAFAADGDADGTIAIGGGSTIGLGKAIALRTDFPQIAVPTTYAGSEMTNILGETCNGEKITRRSPQIQPETVIYDPDLFLTLPVGLSVTSGLNALAHAVEGLYAEDSNPVTSILAIEAARRLAAGLPAIVGDSSNRDARELVMIGAHLAGTVLGSVAMSLHHKLCHVLGGSFNLPHGETHSVILPYAVAYNEVAAAKCLAPLSTIFPNSSIAAGLQQLARRVGAPRSLKELGFDEAAIESASQAAMGNAYGNPRVLQQGSIARLLEDAFHGRDVRVSS